MPQHFPSHSPATKEDIERILEKLDEIRLEGKIAIKTAAHELRQDASFITPYWKDGASHISDHFFTGMAKKLLWAVLGALASAVLLWLGSKGVKP